MSDAAEKVKEDRQRKREREESGSRKRRRRKRMIRSKWWMRVEKEEETENIQRK